MNKNILNSEVQDFIQENLDCHVAKLLLKGSPFEYVSGKELVQQIESKKKAQKKLLTWFSANNIYYPPKISIEQSSSEKTAFYKSQLVHGKSLADITGGFGVDSYYFSEKIEKVYHYEINKDLSEIVAHNLKQLNSKVSCFAEDGIQAIEDKFFDVIYIDPSRRSNTKGKVFYLNDCEPNIVTHLNYLLNRCETLLIKTSPMLDISVGMKELENVHQIHIVSLNNDVKELLWLVKNEVASQLKIRTVNLKKDGQEIFDYFPAEELKATFSNPKKYLYEPNSAIMKSGAFDAVSAFYKIDKLDMNTHLYTSDSLIEFPGRVFTIENVIPYSKEEMKKQLAKTTANLTTRNFPESVEVIRKKWKIKDGGNNYLFFTTLTNAKKVILDCRKI